MITLTGACTTLAAEQTPVSIHVYGPGGPAPAMKAAAELFEQRTGARAPIVSGPLPKWENEARLDAGVFFSGSENMMTAFSTAFEGQRSEEHTSGLQSLLRREYAVFSLLKTD